MKNKIIDMHTHIYPTALARRAMEVAGRQEEPYGNMPVKENLLARMEREEITLSVVLHVVSKPRTQTDVNRFAGEIERRNLISFGGLHPDCENPIEELEKLKDLGMSGVKFHPPFQRVHLSDGRYREIWKRINHLRFPVLIHCGHARFPGEFDFFPSDAEKILRDLPDVPVILAHMGGRPKNPLEEEILFRLPENVYLDTAMSSKHQAAEEFERIAGRFGPERVLYGSDFPYDEPGDAIRYIKNSALSQEEKAKMLGGNAERLFAGVGIDLERGRK